MARGNFSSRRTGVVANQIETCYNLTMTKIEQLAQTATALGDDQLDGLIAYATYLVGEPLYYSAPADVLASIERGLVQHRSGGTHLAADVFARLQTKIAAPRT